MIVNPQLPLSRGHGPNFKFVPSRVGPNRGSYGCLFQLSGNKLFQGGLSIPMFFNLLQDRIGEQIMGIGFTSFEGKHDGSSTIIPWDHTYACHFLSLLHRCQSAQEELWGGEPEKSRIEKNVPGEGLLAMLRHLLSARGRIRTFVGLSTASFTDSCNCPLCHPDSEPRRGFEPPTFALQKRCSAVELPRRISCIIQNLVVLFIFDILYDCCIIFV